MEVIIIIKLIYELGKHCGENLLYEDPFPNNRFEKRVIVLNINDCKFTSVQLEEYNQDLIPAYGYKRRSANGLNGTPCAKLITVEKENGKSTINLKIIEWFKRCPELSHIEGIIKDNIVEITKQMYEHYEEGINTLFMVKIDGKYPGEIPIIMKYSKKYQEEDACKDSVVGTCQLCGTHTAVSKKFCPIKIYTTDKECFNGNFYMCGKCYKYIDMGKQVADKYLHKRIFGMDFYILPSAGPEILRQIINHYRTFDVSSIYNQDNMEKFRDFEDILFNVFNGDYSLNFIVKNEGQQEEFKVKYLIENVNPSRILQVVDEIRSQNTNGFKVNTYTIKRLLGNDKTFSKYMKAMLLGKTIKHKEFVSDFAPVLQLGDRKRNKNNKITDIDYINAEEVRKIENLLINLGVIV